MTDSPADQPFSIKFGDREYPLVPSVPALRAIERTTGSSLFALVEAGSDGALSIDHMTCLAACMVKAPANDPLFDMAQKNALNPVRAVGSGASVFADGIAAEIVGAGVAYSLGRLIAPIIAAFGGRTDAAGNLKPTEA